MPETEKKLPLSSSLRACSDIGIVIFGYGSMIKLGTRTSTCTCVALLLVCCIGLCCVVRNESSTLDQCRRHKVAESAAIIILQSCRAVSIVIIIR